MAAGNNDQRTKPDLSDEYESMFRALNQNIAKLNESRSGPDLVAEQNAHARLRTAERLLTHFTSMISPLADSEPGWSEQFATVHAETLEQGTRQVETVGISLQALSQWNGLTTVHTVEKKGRAAGSEKVVVRGYLPPVVIRQAFQQLQQLTDEFGWLPGGDSSRDRYHATGGDEDEYPEPFGNAEPPEDD